MRKEYKDPCWAHLLADDPRYHCIDVDGLIAPIQKRNPTPFLREIARDNHAKLIRLLERLG
jgi:hypothetical protein